MFTIESFCNHVWGISYSKVLQNIKKEDYQTFTIPKKNGSRQIQFLKHGSELDNLQLALNKYLQGIPLPVCVKGFKRGVSYNDFLSEHIGAEHFMRVDIASFFPSIHENIIKNELTYFIPVNDVAEKEKVVNLICDIVSLNNELPQGARTSPTVSNIIMTRIDQRITKYCQLFGVRYTRYADDMLFSSSEFSFIEKRWFLKKIKHILSSLSLKLNYEKLKFGHKEIVLNGYIISATGIRLSRNRLSDIRHVITCINKNYAIIKAAGEDAFLQKMNSLSLKHRDLSVFPFKTVFQVTQYLVGYRSYLISMADASDTSPFQNDLQRLIRRIEKQVCILS